MGFQLDSISTQKKTKSVSSDIDKLLQKEIIVFKKPFSNKIKEDFYVELSVLLKAGVGLKEALELIENSLKKKQAKAIVGNLSQQIVSGLSLSEALQQEPHFSSYEYHSVQIGEETGTLDLVFEQLGSFYIKKNEQRRNLINALTYPIIILCTAILVVIFMLNFVVPMFQDIFKQQNVELPGITKFIIGASEFIQQHGLLLFLGFIAALISQSYFNKKEWWKRYKSKLQLKIPFFGNFIKTIYLAQFTQAVSLLTASKVPMLNSINLVRKMIDFYPLQSALQDVEENLLKGESLSSSLQQHSFFEPKMIALVKVAEETNQNEYIFQRLNDQYNNQIQQQSKLFSTVLEPLIIIVIGGLVGIILIAMYLPMFKLSSVLT